MKILYICRLFSGFEHSLEQRIWEPRGAPTIAKMISKLDQSESHKIKLIFTCKDYNSSWSADKDQTIELDGLKSPITILAGQNAIPSWTSKFREKLSDIRQFFKIRKAANTFKPDLIYCDRVNLFPAAMLARSGKAPVIWRIMGILDNMHEGVGSSSIRDKFRQYLWRSPFAHVICTLDGSGGGPWMNKALDKDVPCTLMLNGFDFTQSSQRVAQNNNEIPVLFVGRLEALKGAEEFLDAAIELASEANTFKFYVAGGGSMKEELQSRINESGLGDKITLLGETKPEDLVKLRNECEIYVSLNKQGNLSNVNLEALASGLAIIVPQSHDPVDIDTDNLVPKDVFYRFGEVGDNDKLIEAIKKFEDKELRQTYQNNARKFASETIMSWDERIQNEIELLEKVVQK